MFIPQTNKLIVCLASHFFLIMSLINEIVLVSRGWLEFHKSYVLFQGTKQTLREKHYTNTLIFALLLELKVYYSLISLLLL